MRLAIYLTSLSAGGSERVFSHMANHWAEKGWEIIALTSETDSDTPFFRLHPAVKCVPMRNAGPYAGIARALWRNVRRLVRVRHELIKAKADCVLAFGESNAVRAVLATLGLKVPLVVTERSEPSYIIRTKNGRIWHALRSLCYPLADRVVVLTEEDKSFFSRRIQRKTEVVPCAAVMGTEEGDDLNNHSRECPDKTIAAVGRLVREKRFDLLLQAFADVAKDHDCSLVIVGDGPLRNELERLVSSLGLSERVSMPGFIHSPWSVLKRARMLVVSSEVESFGNAILEAMAHGVPVVSFDCPNGPRNIIRNGVDGILVPPLDVAALARAMARLLEDDGERTRMAGRAVEVSARFSEDSVMARWEEVIFAAVTHNRTRRTCEGKAPCRCE